MSVPAAPDFGDYSKLIDDEGLYDNFTRIRTAEFLLRLVRLQLSEDQGPGLYRASTVALAALCVILLICVIALSAHKQKNQNATPQTEKQKQEFNVSELLSTINKLQEENKQLWAKVNASKAVQPTSPPLQCAENWVRFGSSCYLISFQNKNWFRAKSYCETEGGHLAIILTAEEQTFLWDRLPRGHWNSFWFGITDSHTEDQWKWVDGTPVVDGFWEEGEPNNHINEDCGYIVKTEVLTRVAIRSWYDAPCDFSLPFICEKEDSAAAATTQRAN
ncbi:hypothetical protein WMY93_019087 [Mugilogobius chulae]|uniref:C-type lectin domain-containing protein n=1 Tax=Mugilogobius chulae TaxID=88201 RepID=A0AAW0NQE9_9GOBI